MVLYSCVEKRFLAKFNYSPGNLCKSFSFSVLRLIMFWKVINVIINGTTFKDAGSEKRIEKGPVCAEVFQSFVSRELLTWYLHARIIKVRREKMIIKWKAYVQEVLSGVLINTIFKNIYRRKALYTIKTSQSALIFPGLRISLAPKY